MAQRSNDEIKQQQQKDRPKENNNNHVFSVILHTLTMSFPYKSSKYDQPTPNVCHISHQVFVANNTNILSDSGLNNIVFYVEYCFAQANVLHIRHTQKKIAKRQHIRKIAYNKNSEMCLNLIYI